MVKHSETTMAIQITRRDFLATQAVLMTEAHSSPPMRLQTGAVGGVDYPDLGVAVGLPDASPFLWNGAPPAAAGGGLVVRVAAGLVEIKASSQPDCSWTI